MIVFGASAHAQDGSVPFSTERWDFDPSKGTIVEQDGQQSLRLSTTAATLKDVVFRDGIYFANFRYTPAEESTPLLPQEPTPSNVLSRWELSKAFTAEEIDTGAYPAVARSGEAGWQAVRSEASGMVNISRYRSRPARPSIVLARTTLRSTSDQIKKMHFGYSDDVVVYLNEKPLYARIGGFRSRNPTYQGFVTPDDVVYLDLQAGDNEVLFVVSEVFGGWGFMAWLEDAVAGTQ
ncbi:MAG: hypothetical protein IH820_08150 [Bacteroidetes bacterium]|nr:hypothetical protein [Bacteroidota bacterium]